MSSIRFIRGYIAKMKEVTSSIESLNIFLFWNFSKNRRKKSLEPIKSISTLKSLKTDSPPPITSQKNYFEERMMTWHRSFTEFKR